MQNYELKIRLDNLTLTEENGKMSWIGTDAQNDKVVDLVIQYENHERDK